MKKEMKLVAILLALSLLLTGATGCTQVNPSGSAKGDDPSETGTDENQTTETDETGASESETGDIDPGEAAGSGITIGSTSKTVIGDYAFLFGERELKTFYVKVSGETQGEIRGTCGQRGEVRDAIVANAFSTEYSGLFDQDSGIVYQHRTLSASFTHRIDISSQSLRRASENGEKLSIKVMRKMVASDGSEIIQFSATYTDALIKSITMVRDTQGGYFEKVDFDYSGVTIAYGPTGEEWHGGASEEPFAEREETAYLKSEKPLQFTTTSAYSKMCMTVTGKEQGVMAGEVLTEGHPGEYPQPEGSFRLYDYSTGDLVTFVHKVDGSTPKIQKAATTGEELTLKMIETGQDSGGYEILANSVEYTGAVIVSADIFTEGASGNLMERVTLRYERADFRDEINGSTCTVRPEYSRISNPVTALSEGYTFLSPDKDYRMYMAVTGERQGSIEGNYIGRSGAYDKTIPTYAYSAGIGAKYNEANSFETPRQKTATVVHKVDNTTPKLLKAAADGERLEITILRDRNNGNGAFMCFMAKYAGAVICDNEIFTDEATGLCLEKITFTFESVEYTDPVTGTVWKDDWR